MLLDFDDEFTATQDGTSPGAQAITATAIGRNVINNGQPKDFGAGECLTPYLRVPAAFNNLTSLTVDIVAADNAALTTNPVVLSTKTILLAALTANSLHALPPLAAGSRKQYLGARFTVTGTAPSTGSVICGLVPMNGRPQNGVNAL